MKKPESSTWVSNECDSDMNTRSMHELIEKKSARHTIGSQEAVELEQVRAHVERVLKRHEGVFRTLVRAAWQFVQCRKRANHWGMNE